MIHLNHRKNELHIPIKENRRTVHEIANDVIVKDFFMTNGEYPKRVVREGKEIEFYRNTILNDEDQLFW